ncbi:putative MPP superfamily phosphohydrolase [Saccharothrix ecbatanensis]|uniref:Putative MPP superfamily phosphohydrolase n=1 Tax=Saccharothrix ecbatanensis TaxID=1105145 RepID=A0A7W9M2J1_9PSEU|nr:metallophosphoesterase [Saccharothrix ecbatanensis]MBB5805019.1 putative MPP superfamily phosphohydrolase [Saccharothrix ecbatanensis]
MFFFVLFAVVMGAAHYYIWKRAVRDTTLPGRGRRIGTVVVLLLYVLVMAGLSVSRLGWALGDAVAWPGFIWLAGAFYFSLILGVLEIPRLLMLRSTRRLEVAVAAGVPNAVAETPETPEQPEAPEQPADPGRRLFIARSLAVVGGVATAGVVTYGATQALGDPVLKRVPVTLGKLDPRLSGYRIAVVSDIHLGPLLGRAHTERVVRMINEQQVDLVAIVGDLVDGTVDELGEAAAPLRDLVSTHGSFFVTGNHEYYSGAEPWLTELDRLGVSPLRNERLTIERAGASFDLAGVSDVTGAAFDDGPDYARALDGRDTSKPVVLMAHQPVQVREAAKHGVDLQLSGHTHGGQMFPFHLAVGLQQPMRSGLETIDGTQVYTTNGVGFWGPPVRVGAPPDITVLELHHNFAGR